MKFDWVGLSRLIPNILHINIVEKHSCIYKWIQAKIQFMSCFSFRLIKDVADTCTVDHLSLDHCSKRGVIRSAGSTVPRRTANLPHFHCRIWVSAFLRQEIREAFLWASPRQQSDSIRKYWEICTHKRILLKKTFSVTLSTGRKWRHVILLCLVHSTFVYLCQKTLKNSTGSKYSWFCVTSEKRAINQLLVFVPHLFFLLLVPMGNGKRFIMHCNSSI